MPGGPQPHGSAPLTAIALVCAGPAMGCSPVKLAVEQRASQTWQLRVPQALAGE